MTTAFADYNLIAGNHGPRGSLWEGPDHLLVVEGRGWPLSYQEIYRRVDYTHVQSLTLVRTKSYLWLNLAWGFGALLYGFFIFLAWSSERYVFISLVAPEALLLVGFLLHLIRGPTCACALQTNVQLLRLRPLHRTRTAEPAMQKLVALCQRHQAGMSSAESESSSAASSLTRSPEEIAGAKPPWSGTVWTAVCGGALILWGLALGAELFVPGIPFAALDGALGGAAFCLSITALARATRMRVPGHLLGTLWAGLVAELTAAAALYVLAVAAVIRTDVVGAGRFDPKRSFSNERVIAAISDFRFDEAGRWGWGLIILGAVLALIGVATLAFGGVKKGAAPQAPPSPGPPAMPPGTAA